ncbi:MAG: mechanosensitive ion channel family protein [Sphingobium sp.]
MPANQASNQTQSVPDDIRIPSDELESMVDSSLSWLSSHVIQIAIVVAIGCAIYLGLALVKGMIARLRDRGGPIDFATLIGRTAARTTHFFMVMVAARLVVGYADPPVLVFKTVAFLFTVATVWQAAMWAREFILGMIERRASQENDRSEALANAMGLIRVLVTFALFAIAAIMLLDNLGVNVTGLVAGLGIGGIAIGLAAQGIFSDLFAALSIIFDRPFRQGDTIQYDQSTATVEHIGLKSTRLRSVDGEAKIISNANLLQKEITNYRDIARRRYAMPIGVIYQTPPEKAERIPEILQQVIEGAGAQFQRAAFVGFGASSLDFEVYFFALDHDADKAIALRHKVGMAILKRFNEEGLEFAYPTQTTFTAAPDGAMIYPYSQSS